MAEFAKEVEKVAADKGKNYYTVMAEMGKFMYKDGTSRPTIDFKCYISDYGYFSGETPNDCLKSLKDKVYPKKSLIEEVLV